MLRRLHEAAVTPACQNSRGPAMPRTPPAPLLDAATASLFAQVALANVQRRYPFHLTHLMQGDADLQAPHDLYPLFHGSYDWHSCVHMHWTLARCLRRHPQLPEAAAVHAHFDERFTPAAAAQELAYFNAGRASFERPYGWGWLLKLHTELQALAATHPAAAPWRDALAPLAQALAQRFIAWLPQADFPVRAGTHGNTAFALLLALEHAQAWPASALHSALQQAIRSAALRWFSADRHYPVAYEPSGDDFLSGGLCEALLMRRLLGDAGFAPWWAGFAADDASATGPLSGWLKPVPVSAPEDPKIVHLHGLNLSRAWCWQGLQPGLPAALQPAVQAAVAAHLRHSLPAATGGHYVGTHWLASFALLALDDALPGDL